MKTKICQFPIFLSFFLACTLYAGNCLCQWEEDVRQTYDPYPSWLNYVNGARAVVAHGDTLHVVWQDQRDGNGEVFTTSVQRTGGCPGKTMYG